MSSSSKSTFSDRSGIQGCIIASDIRMGYSEPIALEAMAQQPHLRGTEDDWTGVTSSAKRRRVQNRLNQRAYRKRKRNENPSCLGRPRSPLHASQNQNYDRSGVSSASPDSPKTELESPSPMSGCNGLRLFLGAAERGKMDCQKLRLVAAVSKLSAIEQQMAISEIEQWIVQSQTMGSPTIDHLLVLVKYNVFRAMISNGLDLGYAAGQGMDDDDALSPFSNPSNSTRILPVPAALQPTKLQRQLPHHPWIDTVPIPGMRDNLLRAGDTFDDEELCADLIGFCNVSAQRTGMILWGEPWDPDSWELTEEFLSYWGWTVKGCKQLLHATNYWRKRRGEEPLEFDRALVEEVND